MYLPLAILLFVLWIIALVTKTGGRFAHLLLLPVAALLLLHFAHFRFDLKTQVATFAISQGLNPNATMKDCVVLLTAEAQAAPSRIILRWKEVPKNSGYTVSRRDKDNAAWKDLASLPPGDRSYTDATAVIGKEYEYKVATTIPTISVETACRLMPSVVKLLQHTKSLGYEMPISEFGHLSGSVLSGIEVPLKDLRGKVILLVDSTVAKPLTTEIQRLQRDLTGDGWFVIRHDIQATESIVSIRELVRKEYQADPVNVKSVFILGHLPVPYSGCYAPDGHDNRFGAQPADVFYASMDGIWTDSTVTTKGKVLPGNVNLPGDGRFDQSEIPGKTWLELGRVDFNHLPAFAPLTAVDLLRRYLEKDHAYRHKAFTVNPGCLAEDALAPLPFAPLGYSFCMAAVHTCTPMFGADKVTLVKENWLKTLCDTGSQWAFAFAGSQRDHCGNIVSTKQLVHADPKTVFTGLYGSYFGDWPVEDDVMRAMIATKTYTLACAYASAPPINFHAMSLGETAGYGIWYSQHADVCPGTCAGRVHIALMGDPTLRMHIVAPPKELSVMASGSSMHLTWKPSTEPSVLGYHVYRATTERSPFVRLTQSPVAECVFTEAITGPGNATYMVRAIKLETSASGSYFNGSQGVFATTRE